MQKRPTHVPSRFSEGKDDLMRDALSLDGEDDVWDRLGHPPFLTLLIHFKTWWWSRKQGRERQHGSNPRF